MLKSFLFLGGLLVSTALGNPELTSENFDELTKDKAVFLRFVTDWCEDCVETESAWRRLEDEWKDHSLGLVAEIHCDSDDSEDICESFQVSGYPSVYHGDPESPEIYTGSLDYSSLAAFAEQNLRTLPCSLKNLNACDVKVQRMIGELRQKSQEELEVLEKELLEKVDEEQNRFDQAALKLQQRYKELANNFNTKIDKLRDDSGFKWIQQVLNEMYDANEEPENDEL